MIPRFFEPTLETVARYREQRSSRGLIRALRAHDFRVSEAASDALVAMGGGITRDLLEILRKGDQKTRLSIIGIFSKIRDPGTVDPLIELLSDLTGEIRWQATIALGEIGDPRATGPLVRALADHDKYVRFGAATALTKLAWEPAGSAEMAGYYAAVQEWDAVKNIGQTAIPALANLLNDRDPIIRLKAVRTLGQIGGSDASPAIIRALSDDNRDVRWQAVLASQHCAIPLVQVPHALSARPKTRKNPLIAAFMNFMLPGLGYGYLGKWWGIMIFQVDITITVWLFKVEGESSAYLILFPVYFILAIHAWYIAENMPEEPA